MHYKMQSLDSHSGIVGLNYHLQHYYTNVPDLPGTQEALRSQLQALRAYAAYSTDLEMTWFWLS